MRLLAAATITAAVLVLAGGARAQDASKVGIVSNVKVLSDKCEDVSSPEAWKQSCIKEGMSDKDKAIAIWKTVIKYRHQTGPPNEGIASGGCVADPLKTINVYGYGMCCCAASNVEGLARYLGYECRGRIIAAHSVPEVKIDGQWSLLDGSVMNYFIKEDGTFASVDDIRKAVTDWFQQNPDEAQKLRGKDGALRAFAKNEGWKKGPALLARCEYYEKDGANAGGWHGWMSNMQEYDFPDPAGPNKKKDLGAVFDYGASMGYRVNVQLREGERLTRCWHNKGLVINGADAGLIKGSRAGLGLQRKFGDMAPGRIGNGVLEYDVPLASGAFRLGALAAENLQAKSEGAATGVAVKDASKNGELVIRMPSSYVYLNGAVALTAAVGQGGSLSVFFSDNHALDWKQIGTFDKPGDQKIDLKDKVFRKYDYRLKFVLAGAGTGLDALKITHDIQHSQAPLPVITEGDNKIAFSAGPAEGTITYEGNLEPSKPKGNLTYLDFHPVVNGLSQDLLRVGNSGRGDITFSLAAPGDLTRIRMNSHYRCRDTTGRDYWDAEVSFDGGKTFKKIDRFDKGQPASNKYVTFAEVPAGAREAQVRLSAVQKNTVCMFDLRMDADYKEPNGGFRPVKVTYLWEEGGAQKQDEHVCKTPEDSWTIKCGPKTVAKSYTVELAK